MILALAAGGITWIKVERPTFDLVGVVLGALGLAAALAVAALVLGSVLGVAFILRSRRLAARNFDDAVRGLGLHHP